MSCLLTSLVSPTLKRQLELAIDVERSYGWKAGIRSAPSASQPDLTAPSGLSPRVTDSTNATSVNGTWNSCEIGTMMRRNMVKSKESSVQPSHAAHQTSHWSLVGS